MSTSIDKIDDFELKVLPPLNYIADDCLYQSIFDLTIDTDTRINALERYYELNQQDTIEIISKLSSVYQFSGTKSLEHFLYKICTHSNIYTLLKLEAAKSLLSFEEFEEDIEDEDLKEIIIKSNACIVERNKKRKELAFKALDTICYDLQDLPTPCKIEAVCMLMENITYKIQSLHYFNDIINNQKIECDYRYKTILSLEKRSNITDKKFFLKKSLLEFLFNKNNRTMYRILSGQYLLQKIEDLSNNIHREIQFELLGFAKDEELDYNLRADSSDTLLNLGEEDIKLEARKIIMILGSVLGEVRTIFDNAQNVHNDVIENSVLEALEFLSFIPLLEISSSPIDFNYVSKQIEDMLEKIKITYSKENTECKKCYYCLGNLLQKDFCSNVCLEANDKQEKIKISLNRICIDRILYSKYNQTLINIFLKIWTYLSGHEAEETMKERLLEELYDMSGTCSSGFASRLINVISGFGQFNIRISWEDQIIANFTGRLNSKIRNITEPNSIYYTTHHKDIVELYLREQGVIKKRENAEELESKDTLKSIIDEYLVENKDEKIKIAVENFSDNVLIEMAMPSNTLKKHFDKVFRDYMLVIREELYEEFKDYISDSEFDLYSRKAIASYEGQKI